MDSSCFCNGFFLHAYVDSYFDACSDFKRSKNIAFLKTDTNSIIDDFIALHCDFIVCINSNFLNAVFCLNRNSCLSCFLNLPFNFFDSFSCLRYN